MRRYLILGACILAFAITSHAQIHSGAFTMGYTIPNESKYPYVGQSTYGIEYAYSKRIEGGEYWKQFWQWPTFGLRASIANSPNGIAGTRLGVNGFMQVPIANNFEWTLGLGLSAYTKPFAVTHDYRNHFIGSVINCLIDLGVLYRIPIQDIGSADISLRFLHSSNGYLQKPNQGLNFVQFGMGYSFAPNGMASHSSFDINENPNHYPLKNSLFISVAPGIVQSRITNIFNYYYTYTVQFGYMRRFHPCMAYGINLDIMQNGSHPMWLEAIDEYYPLPFYLGICANYECYFGPFSVRLSLGTNLTYSSLVSLPFYEHVGGFYHFGDKLKQYAGLSLKAYAAHIDYIEWTYGIHLPIGKQPQE